jgi:hypothetical protein
VSYQYPDKITVEEEVEVEIAPEHAVLEIVVEGESVFFGNEAFEQSKEISHLVSELEKIEYLKENITLQGVSIRTTTGKLLKSSSARFTLRLDKIKLEFIPKILGIVSIQKNIEIINMAYDFGRLEERKHALILEACSKAKVHGQEVCLILGVPMLGVYSMSQNWSIPFAECLSENYSAEPLARGRTEYSSPSALAGLDFTANHKSKLRLALKVDFRVGLFSAN